MVTTIRAYSIIAAASLALSKPIELAVHAVERLAGFFWSVVAFFVRSIAYPPTIFATPAGTAPFDPMSVYRSPPDKMLRHEASMSQRAAERHV